MKGTDWTLDTCDVEYYSKEFAEYAGKENGFGSALFCMSNEKLSDSLFSYFKNRFENMKQWKTPMGQFFTFGEKGERELADSLHKSIAEKKRLIAEMESVLQDLPESFPVIE
jgi:hypothetical protein